MREYEYAAVLQGKILDKYGALNGISKDLLDRIGAGTATPDEVATYTQNADRLVATFKADMRQTASEGYSDLDIEIITAMAATNYETYQSRDEPFAKVVYPDSVTGSLKDNKAPAFYGFAASLRYSEDLSPPQVVSQFGLDYQGTPFLIRDGDTDKPVPFLYSMVSPMTQDLRDTLRVPFDPRIFDRIEQIANDATRSDLIRQMAVTMTSKDVAYIAVRGTASPDETKALVQQYKDKGYAVREKSADAPLHGQHHATVRPAARKPELLLDQSWLPTGTTWAGGASPEASGRHGTRT